MVKCNDIYRISFFFCVQKQRFSIDVFIFFIEIFMSSLQFHILYIIYHFIQVSWKTSFIIILVSLDPFHFHHRIYLFLSGYVSHTIHVHAKFLKYSHFHTIAVGYFFILWIKSARITGRRKWAHKKLVLPQYVLEYVTCFIWSNLQQFLNDSVVSVSPHHEFQMYDCMV